LFFQDAPGLNPGFVVAYLLTDHATIGLDAKEYPAAAMVEHRAKGGRRLAWRPC
jgi:hypothetical protein